LSIDRRTKNSFAIQSQNASLPILIGVSQSGFADANSCISAGISVTCSRALAKTDFGMMISWECRMKKHLLKNNGLDIQHQLTERDKDLLKLTLVTNI
jgi:hypothetical protein